MRNYWDTDVYYSQPSEAELNARKSASVRKEQNKGKLLKPVVVTGRAITKNWWGNAWCENLEQYADFESRLSRGKRYVRTGAVIDLKIQKGKILARVQGTRKSPYKIEIRISPVSEEKCQEILQKCSQRIENMEELLSGNFPLQMQELFIGQSGLFPTPKEISFNCSCPDWALMCKHVAATLYGVGVRLDSEPLLFFELRGIDPGHFVDVAIANKVEMMLTHAEHVTGQDVIVSDRLITDLFGVI